MVTYCWKPSLQLDRRTKAHLGGNVVGLAQGAVELADGHQDGAISADGQILPRTAMACSTILDALTALLLAWAGMTESAQIDFAACREADLDRLADSVEAALDWGKNGWAIAPSGGGLKHWPGLLIPAIRRAAFVRWRLEASSPSRCPPANGCCWHR